MNDVDILLDADGDLYWPMTLVSGDKMLAQRMMLRLETGVGSWALDLASGLPWLEWVGATGLNFDIVQDYLRREIEDMVEVERVLFIKATPQTSGTVNVEMRVLLRSESTVGVQTELSASRGVLRLAILPLS